MVLLRNIVVDDVDIKSRLSISSGNGHSAILRACVDLIGVASNMPKHWKPLRRRRVCRRTDCQPDAADFAALRNSSNIHGVRSGRKAEELGNRLVALIDDNGYAGVSVNLPARRQTIV